METISTSQFELNQTIHSLGTDCTKCTDRRITSRTWRVSPFSFKVCNHTVVTSTAIWVSLKPPGVGDFGAIGPHPPALQQSVGQPNPGIALVWVKVLDESSHQVVFPLAVDGHYIGVALRQAVLLSFGKGHGWGDVRVAATFEAVHWPRTGSTLQLHLCSGISMQDTCIHTHTHTQFNKGDSVSI